MSGGVDYSRIQSCIDVTDDDIKEALSPAQSLAEPTPRQRALALLERMASVAQPRQGAPRILVLVANMAMHDWIEGDLEVKLIGDDEITVLELLVDDGMSQERIAGPTRVDVSIAEFRNAVNLRPDLIRPLAATGRIEPRRITLRGSRSRLDENAPPSFSAFASGLMRAVSGKALGSQKLRAVRLENVPARTAPAPPATPPRPPPPRGKKSIATYERAAPTIEFPEEYRRSKGTPGGGGHGQGDA